MTDSGEAARQQVRTPLQRRTRRRWAIAGGVAAGWLVGYRLTGSALGATVLLVAIAGLGVACVTGLRAMGITRDHPWLRRMATRPWRDGRDVLNVVMHHLPEVFIVTPSGSLLAPDVVELQMNPDDLASLRARMDLDVVSASLTQVYEEQVAKRGARLAGSAQPEVYIVADDSVPQGRYQLQRGVPAGAYSAPGPGDLLRGPGRADRPFAHAAATSLDAASVGFTAGFTPELGYAQPAAGPGYGEPVGAGRGARTRSEGDSGRTVMDGMPTVMEQIRPAIPVLRLVTGSSVAETAVSGARAGRGPVELALPEVPTVSRVHAIFTFAAGRWWVTNQGANGLSVNGLPVSAKHPLSDGDAIRWGKSPDAPLSRVEIG